MNCRDCLHYEVCRLYSKKIRVPMSKDDICDIFTNRSEWVHLPCKVEDKTFLLLEKTSGGYDIVESKCVRITDNGYGKHYSMYFDCAELGNTLEFDIYDFGKWVFLTREEAEKALEGMK